MALLITDRTSPRAAPSSPAAPLVALVIGAIAMGISPIFVRGVSGDIGPFASAFWRVTVALPVLYAWTRIEQGGGPVSWRPDLATIGAGLAFTFDLLFWHLSILGTTVANATFFATTAPIFVVLIAWVVLRSPPARTTVAGLALCLIGGAALIGQSLQVAPERLTGDIEGLATAFFFGLYFLFVERARTRSGAARVTFSVTVIAAAMLLVAALTLDAGRVWPTSAQTWLVLLALGWISHAGGQGLLSLALGRLPAEFSSLVIFLEAVCAAAAGWAVLGEALSPIQLLGGVAIVLGIWDGASAPVREGGRVTARRLSLWLAASGLAGTLLLGATAARADLRLCNMTESRVGISLGYRDANGWVTEGWWNVKPRGCDVLLKGDLAARFYYLYAVDYDRGGDWSGRSFMCTREREFTIRGVEDCLARGFDRTGFFEIDSGEQKSWTIQLTDPGRAGAAPPPEPTAPPAPGRGTTGPGR